MVADCVGVTAAVMAGGWAAHLAGGSAADVLTALAYAPIIMASLGIYGLYRRGRRRLVASTFPDLGPLLHALTISSLIIVMVNGPAHQLIGLPRLHHVAIVVIAVAALVAVPLLRMVSRRLIPGGRARRSRVVIVGSGIVGTSVAQRLATRSDIDVIGYVDEHPLTFGFPPSALPLLGGLTDIPSVLAAHDVDHLVVAFTPINESALAGLLRSLSDHVRISIVPRMFDLLTVRSCVEDLVGLPVVDVAPPSLGLGARMAKRTLDISVSGAALLVLAPLLLVIAAVIRSTSPGPALFKQQRTGRGGRPFPIRKFRTMHLGAEQERERLASENEVDGPLFKIKCDPRITSVGRFLRRSSLDELPQLINVFLGDMSLVGPRPFVTAESAEIEGWAARRFAVRPGMTGLWQVSGRNDLPFEDLRRLDYCYVASWSLWWDLRILWHTPSIVFGSRGAY
ncbi:MAG: sugar transferase [Acidimicrobiales bacterium]